MKIILISNPVDIEKEHDLINALFEEGLDYFHLRKPETSLEEMELFIKKIKPAFVKKISIHSHFNLLKKYNIGGIHFPEEMLNDIETKEITKLAQKRGIKTSTSVHSTSDLKGIKIYDYVFLSPVFDSISKEAYKAMNEATLQNILHQLKISAKLEIIALGGIDSTKIPKVIELGFDGIALHGTIWKNPDKAIETFNSIKTRIEEL
jgi:thiamine-phosphate pyrophosphorylase